MNEDEILRKFGELPLGRSRKIVRNIMAELHDEAILLAAKIGTEARKNPLPMVLFATILMLTDVVTEFMEKAYAGVEEDNRVFFDDLNEMMEFLKEDTLYALSHEIGRRRLIKVLFSNPEILEGGEHD